MSSTMLAVMCCASLFVGSGSWCRSHVVGRSLHAVAEKRKGCKVGVCTGNKRSVRQVPQVLCTCRGKKTLVPVYPVYPHIHVSMYSVPVQTTPVPSTQYVHLGSLNDSLVSPPHCTCAHAHPHLHPRLRFVFPFSLPPPSICIFFALHPFFFSGLLLSFIFLARLFHPIHFLLSFTLSSGLLLVASLWFPRFRPLLSSISSGDT